MNKENNSVVHTDLSNQNGPDNGENEIILNLETKNLLGIGIVKSVIYKSKKEHIISFDFNDDKKCLISFFPRRISATNLLEEIKKKLFQTLGFTDDCKEIKDALLDIEDQIIRNRHIVFDTHPDPVIKNDNNYENDSLKQEFIESAIKLNQWIESSLTYEQWQSKVTGKYEKLRQVVEKHYPESWIFMEFCLSVRSILNIQDFTLPFMGVLIAAPSSMKTMIIQLFRKYPCTFYTDSFTPSSLISHISTKTEAELQKVDMIPKMKDKVVLTPELAPIFTSKEDDLQKVMGIVTRLLDGHGLENDSGSHGHRKYGDTMFVWLGAAVEIPPRVWKILGSLGHKIYFLRPDLRKKTIKDLIEIAKNNNFSENNKEIEEALLDYLKTFDAAPQIDNKIKVDGQIVKVKWNEKIEEEQNKSIVCIAQLANLLAHLRDTVYVTESKGTNYKRYSENNGQQQQHLIDGQDYDTDFPVIEDPSRAVILLRNLAIGHAISQGRDSLNLTDIPIVIKVALSTAPLRRVKVLDLLLRKGFNGEVTTSQITHHLSISQPIATRTMRELAALGIVKISTVSNYENSEYKIKQNPEFEWFQSSEFLKLKEEFVPAEEEDGDENQLDSIDEYNENTVMSNKEIPDLSNSSSNHGILSFNDNNCQDNKDNGNMETCDNKICHTLIQNPPSGDAQVKNNVCDNQKEIDESLQQIINDSYLLDNFDLQDRLQQQQKQNNGNITIAEKHNQYNNFNGNITTSATITTDLSKENNNIVSSSPNSLESVTTSHEPIGHTFSKTTLMIKENNDPTFNLVFRELFDIIKLANDSSISFNSAIETLCKNNDIIRNYLGGKLTARENRSVRELQLKIIRHPNIEVIKRKPQLLIRCIDDNITNRGEV